METAETRQTEELLSCSLWRRKFLGRFDIVRFIHWRWMLCALQFGTDTLSFMTTAIVHHPIFREHDTGPGHPENPSRYTVVMDALRGDEELWSRLRKVEAREAPRGDIQAAHSPQLYKHVERVVSEGLGYLDPDTVVSMRSLDAAKRAAGAPCQAIDLIISGEVKNAFVPVRPPGHHAT